jgi:shikimate kinase
MGCAEIGHIVLVGAMGSGKTTIGQRVAAALARPFIDNDDELEQTTGLTAAELAARDGVEALHRAEAALVLGALRAPGESVIAAAASTIEDEDVRSALRRDAWVAWLRADAESLAARLPGSGTRPFAHEDPERLVREQARRRDRLFAEVADATLDTSGTAVDDVVARVLESAGQRRPGTGREDHRRAR